MDWQGRRESSNVDDRRSMKKAGLAIGGAGTLVVIVIMLLTGQNPLEMLGGGGGGPNQPPDPAEEKLVKFVKVVLASTEDVWDEQFRKIGKIYEKPKLVLFRGQVQSACGHASAAIGPFYCPGDHQVYLDLSFFKELQDRFQAPGDFAQAYVIAHEVGHHVQKQLGYTQRVQSQRKRLSETENNRLSVRLELQADFLAGVWGYYAKTKLNMLEPGDLDEAIDAAHAIGDDRLQKQSKGYVVPDSFTHGTSKQRIFWFRRGFDSGDFSKREELFRMRYEDL